MKRTSSKPSAKKTGAKCAVLFAVLFFSALSAPAEIVQEDIFAWWSMDAAGTEPPFKIYAQPGGHSMEMPMSARRVFRQLPYGAAVSFQGGEGAAAELPEPMNTKNGIAISAFIKVRDFPKGLNEEAVIFRMHNAKGNFVDFTVGTNKRIGTWVFLWTPEGGVGCGVHGIDPKGGNWLHLVTAGYGPQQHVTFGGGESKCAYFINGDFRGGFGRNHPIPIDFDLTHVLIGDGYVGALDDVIVFNRGITEEEAMAVYQDDIREMLSVQPKGKLAETWANLKSGS